MIENTQEIIRLAKVISPKRPSTQSDWEEIEKKLGIHFPKDYKHIISLLGDGRFGVNLRFYNPSSRSNLKLSVEILLDLKATFKRVESLENVRFFPDPDGIILIGKIDRQYFGFQQISGESNLEKVVWIDTDIGVVQKTNLGFSDFIISLYKSNLDEEAYGDLRSTIWQDGNTGLEHDFFSQASR